MSLKSIIAAEGVQDFIKTDLGVKTLEEGPLKSEPKPKDRYNLVLITIYIMGTVAALPENFFLTANDFWQYKFGNVSDPESNRTNLQTEFFSVFNAAATSLSVIALLVSLKLISVVSLHKRLLISLNIMLVVIGITLTFTRINTDSFQQVFYIISIAFGAILRACGTGFLNVPLVQLAWKFPPQYLAAQVTGRSICGTLSALIQILALAVTTNREFSGFLYFFIGTQWVVIALGLYMYTSKKSDYFNYHMAIASPPIEANQFSRAIFKSTFLKLWAPLSALTLIMVGSTIVHPGVTSLIKSVDSGNAWTDKFFVPVTTYLLYNVGDLIGREFARKFTLKTNPIFLVVIGFARLIIFVPLILLCNIQPKQNIPVLFNNDYVYIISMILFSLTEGYFGNVCILILPSLMTPRERKLGVAITIVFMMVTVAIFSYASIIIVKFM